MIGKMSQPFLLDPRDKGGLEIATLAVGVIWGTVGVAALAMGGILGGWVIFKWGIKRSVWPMVAAGASNDEIMIARGLAPDWDSQEL